MKKASKTTKPPCGQFFQADTALCFKCGMPRRHKGQHGWCDQTVLANARDVSAERKVAVDVGPCDELGSASDAAMLLFRVRHVAAGTASPDEGVAVARGLAPIVEAIVRACWPQHSFPVSPERT